MPDFVTIGELISLAEKIIPSPQIDRVLTGSGAGQVLGRNRRALDQLAIEERLLTVTNDIDLRASFFNTPLPSPIMMAPMGSLGAIHEDGDLEMARGIGRDGTLSTVRPSKWSIEEVAEQATGPLLYQVNCQHNPTDEDFEVLATIASCEAYKGIAITADGPVPVRMDRYLETRFEGDKRSRPDRKIAEKRFTWPDIDKMRNAVKMPLGMKSIMHPDDARLAIDHGMDFLWVSNHGGRKLDSARATIDVLPDVLEAVDGRVPVFVDGGFRYGSDVFKALAYGASLVAIGKVGSLALGVNGADGVEQLFRILQEELKIAMALSAHTSVAAIQPNALRKITY